MSHQRKCLVLLTGLLISDLLAANVNSGQCRQQIERLIRTSVDCELKVRPDSLKDIVSLSGGLMTDAVCSIPLKFEKSEIYGNWIKKDSVNLPKLRVECDLIGPNNAKFTVTSYIKPSCLRVDNQDWRCTINMSDTNGLGMLGAVLETQINSSEKLKGEMKRFLTSM